MILDTCGLLSLSGVAKKKLSRSTLKEIGAADSLSVSACSLLEIALKAKRGQLNLGERFLSAEAFWEEAVEAYDCDVLPVEAQDFSAAVALPDHHTDPFDRIIIAQAARLKCAVVTYDKGFAEYGVEVSC